ncbi:MAG: beta-propeller fold lactonase family protein [Planctomycetaceae bacterium]
MRGFLMLCAGVMGFTSALRADSVLLVSVSGEQRVARFEIDDTTGELVQGEGFAVNGAPGPMAISPDGRILYVSLRSTHRVASYCIENGGFTPLNEIDVGGSGTFIATDRTGRFLLSAYYAEGRVAVHRIEEDGTLGEEVQTIETAKNAHCIVVDRSNRFVFVPHTGPEKIYQFFLDENTGRLSPNPAGHVDTSDSNAKHEPRHLWFHPTKNYAYVSMEAGSEMGVFRFNPERGTLSPLSDFIPTLPSDFTGDNSTADVELTPDGRFAYVSNRGHDSLAGFRIDATSGEAHSLKLPTTPTESTPRSFNIHPNGKWLYAAGQGSGKMIAYRLGDDGELTPMQTLDVGKSPAWVQVVTTPVD